MAQRRQEIEAFVRRLVAEVEAAEAAGMTGGEIYRAPQYQPSVQEAEA